MRMKDDWISEDINFISSFRFCVKILSAKKGKENNYSGSNKVRIKDIKFKRYKCYQVPDIIKKLKVLYIIKGRKKIVEIRRSNEGGGDSMMLSTFILIPIVFVIVNGNLIIRSMTVTTFPCLTPFSRLHSNVCIPLSSCGRTFSPFFILRPANSFIFVTPGLPFPRTSLRSQYQSRI